MSVSFNTKISKLDVLCRLISVMPLQEACEMQRVITKYYHKVYGKGADTKDALKVLVQIVAKGFANYEDLLTLCDYFPPSLWKILNVLDSSRDVRITNFHEVLVDDLKTILGENI